MYKPGKLVYIDNVTEGDLTIWFDQEPGLVAKIQTIGECTYDQEQMCWITAAHQQKLEELKRAFQDDFVILSSQLYAPLKLIK